MNDQDVREFLERMAVEEPHPSLDVGPLTRRAQHRAARTVLVAAVGVVAAIAVLFAAVTQVRTAPVPADTPTPSPRSEAERIIAKGNLDAHAVTASGTLLTVWGDCSFGGEDCAFAWRLGEGSQPRATGVVRPGRAVFDSGDVFVPVAGGDGFILAPPAGDPEGLRIAPDGTASALSVACRGGGWSTPTGPGRFVWMTGLRYIDTTTGSICPLSRLGGRSLAAGAFTSEGALLALVDNEIGPETLTIGRYDGSEWRYHDFAAPSGSWTSVLAASGSTAAVLLANPEPSPTPDQLMGFAVTTDSGLTWSEVADPGDLARDLPFSGVLSPSAEDWYSGYTSMAFAGTSVLYVADGNGDLWRSTDLATFSQVPVPGVTELRSAGDAVIARSMEDGNDLVRIWADGTVETVTAR